MENSPKSDLSPPTMVFVIGNSRSGTTMMARILGKHPQVYMFEELHFFEQLWQPNTENSILSSSETTLIFAKLLNIQQHGYYNQQDLKPFLDLSEKIIAGKELSAPQVYVFFMKYILQSKHKEIACDHTPRNIYYLATLHQLYPKAKFINMVRDPRDVLLSQKNRWQRRKLDKGKTPLFHTLRTWAGYHPITMSLIWRSGIEAGLSFDKESPILLVKFEELVKKPEVLVKCICGFLGIEYQNFMLQVSQIGSSNRMDSSGGVGIDSTVVGKWDEAKNALRDEEVFLCQHITRKQMKILGYESKDVNKNWVIVLYFFVTWIFKSFITLILNFHRTKNIWQSIKLRFFKL